MAIALIAAVVAHLSMPIEAKGSRCVISYDRIDSEFDPSLMVSCDGRMASLNADNHGVTPTRMSACHALVEVGYSQWPTLYSIDNCAGRLRTANLSVGWEDELIKRARIPLSRVDKVLYEPRKGKPGCYRIRALYPHTLDPKGSSYDSIDGDFCAPSLR